VADFVVLFKDQNSLSRHLSPLLEVARHVSEASLRA
jgi:hypothetical protein